MPLRLRFLLDTNVLSPLQDSMVVLQPSLTNFLHLCNAHGHQLLYHEASLADIRRDTNADRRNRTLARLGLFEGNRVQVPTADSIAAASFWGARTVMTGNLFYQLSTVREGRLPSLIAVTDSANFLALTGNIVHWTWLVYPQRGVPTGVQTSDWGFLNTVG